MAKVSVRYREENWGKTGQRARQAENGINGPKGQKNENWGIGGRYWAKGSITTENGLIGQKTEIGQKREKRPKSILAKNVKIGNV
jgi:hypothetical protein